MGKYGDCTFTVLNLENGNQTTLECNYLSFFDQDGLSIATMRDGKAGVVDRDGKFVVAPEYDAIWLYSEGLAPVRVGEKWDYVDTKGKLVIQPQFDWAYSFSNGMVHVALGDFDKGTFGYIDKTGKYLWKPLN